MANVKYSSKYIKRLIERALTKKISSSDFQILKQTGVKQYSELLKTYNFSRRIKND